MIIAVTTDAHDCRRYRAQRTQSIQDGTFVHQHLSALFLVRFRESQHSAPQQRQGASGRETHGLNAGVDIRGGTGFRNKGRISAGLAKHHV